MKIKFTFSFIYLIIIFIPINLIAKPSISLDSEMTYIKTLKSSDYKSIHSGIDFSYDLGHDYYLKTKLATDISFSKISKAQLELSWMYEFYFFDLHPIIGYGGGYYFLNDNDYNHLIYLRINGGILFHAYDIWKRLKIGTELSTYLFLGTNKYIAISISGVFFVRIEF